MKMLLIMLVAAMSAAKETVVEKAASEAVQKLDKLGVDTVQKRAVIGGVAGMVGGVLLKKTADTVMTCAVLGGAVVGGACYVGWISPAQVEEAKAKVQGAAEGWYDTYFGDGAKDAVKDK